MCAYLSICVHTRPEYFEIHIINVMRTHAGFVVYLNDFLLSILDVQRPPLTSEQC